MILIKRIHKYFGFLTLIYLLSSCNALNNLNDSVETMTNTYKEDCVSNPERCNNRELCNEAVLSGEWQTRTGYIPFVQEAKNRGLSCDTLGNRSENKIDKMMKYALKRLVKLNILSTYEVKNKEEILENMDSTEFNKFYQLCKNAFANSEPAQCDNGIKNLN